MTSILFSRQHFILGPYKKHSTVSYSEYQDTDLFSGVIRVKFTTFQSTDWFQILELSVKLIKSVVSFEAREVDRYRVSISRGEKDFEVKWSEDVDSTNRWGMNLSVGT